MADLLVRTYAVTHPPNLGLPERSFPEWDQLAYASQGVMTVVTGRGSWVVPPHRAVWIPAGELHEVELSGRVSLRTVYFRRGLATEAPADCLAVNVPPLLRELVLRLCELNTVYDDQPAAARLVHVTLDQVATLPVAPLQLPLPDDPRARAVADALRADPARRLDEVVFNVGASRRTIERHFANETGTTLGRWHRRARLVGALRLLASGQPVTSVAFDVGFANPSAFIAAFQRELGTTPGRYFHR